VTLLRRVLGGESGYSLVELLTVMLILGVVLGGLTTLFVRGSNGEVDMNRRFQAQEDSRVALDKIRREAHCAGAAYPASATSVTLADPCVTSGTVTWCTQLITGTALYGLYRSTTSTCDNTNTVWMKSLTSGSVFTYTAQSTSSLAKLHVDLIANPKPTMTVENYELTDDIVFRNSSRTCLTASPTQYASPSPPC
jgi:prepilin-type N-terminal cleavage/methylation domain-containing protein